MDPAPFVLPCIISLLRPARLSGVREAPRRLWFQESFDRACGTRTWREREPCVPVALRGAAATMDPTGSSGHSQESELDRYQPVVYLAVSIMDTSRQRL